MKSTTWKLRLTEEELAEWKAQAANEAMTLAAWIREKCNDGCNGSPVREAEPVRVARRSTVPTQLDAVGTEGPRGKVTTEKRGGPMCKHGVAKGWHCWQCKGMAVIDAHD